MPLRHVSCAWLLCVVVQLFCISSCLSITIFSVIGKQLPNGPSCSPELGICGVQVFCAVLGCVVVSRMLTTDL